MDKVITVSREFGSGGRELGVRLAEHFGIPFYDKELISMAADHADMAETAFQHYDEKLPDMHDPLDRHYYNPFSAVYKVPMSDQIFVAQSSFIRRLAEQGPCVIVGRCADYILRDFEDCLHVFIRSTEEDCIHRVTTYYGVARDKAAEEIKKMDRQRGAHCKRYTDRTWGAAENYDLMLNTARFGIDGCVELIAEAAQRAFHPSQGDSVY